MHNVKAALAGLVGGVLLTAAVLTIQIARAQNSIVEQMANCADYVCDGYAQVGHLKVLAASFGMGFAAAFLWFQRRQRRRAA